MNYEGKIASHTKSYENYTKLVNFMGYEYGINESRTKDFYPYAPHLEKIGEMVQVPIVTEAEYKTYFYNQLYDLLDAADNEADSFPYKIEDKVIATANLIN